MRARRLSEPSDCVAQASADAHSTEPQVSYDDVAGWADRLRTSGAKRYRRGLTDWPCLDQPRCRLRSLVHLGHRLGRSPRSTSRSALRPVGRYPVKAVGPRSSRLPSPRSCTCHRSSRTSASLRRSCVRCSRRALNQPSEHNKQDRASDEPAARSTQSVRVEAPDHPCVAWG